MIFKWWRTRRARKLGFYYASRGHSVIVSNPYDHDTEFERWGSFIEGFMDFHNQAHIKNTVYRMEDD